MGDILGDLAALGYDAEWDCIPAAFVGAPHIRNRVWIVAYPASQGLQGRRPKRGLGKSCRPLETGRGGDALADPALADERAPNGDDTGCSGQRLALQVTAGRSSRTPDIPELRSWPSPAIGSWWITEPSVGRVAAGVPARVDRLRGLGNAVVPQVAEHIGRLILAGAA
jgi:DNA (cytosine-5)-methyltransferase 1